MAIGAHADAVVPAAVAAAAEDDAVVAVEASASVDVDVVVGAAGVIVVGGGGDDVVANAVGLHVESKVVGPFAWQHLVPTPHRHCCY